jgi:hypothetical protein
MTKKESNHKYKISEKGHLANKRYRIKHAKQIQLYLKNYYQKNKKSLNEKRMIYLKTISGKLSTQKNHLLHNPINNLKRLGFIMENCAICDFPYTEFHHPNSKLPFHIYFLCYNCHKEQHIKRR